MKLLTELRRTPVEPTPPYVDRWTGYRPACSVCGHFGRDHVEGYLGGRTDGQPHCLRVHTPIEKSGAGHTCAP